LLREKSCTASKLAKVSGVNRTTVYLELDNLIKKGLASYVIKSSKRYYQAVSPDKLLSILEFRKKRIKSILPKLRSLVSVDEPFKTEIFEGKEGIKTFYQDILSSCKEFYAFGVTGKATEVLEFSYPHFIKEFVKSGIKEKALANWDAKKIMNKHPRRHVKVKYLHKKYKSDVTTVLYAGKVAIQSLQKDNIYVVVIKDKRLFEGYKSYFDFMWDSI